VTKKILITGGAGFIGLNLANKLANIGYKVDIADNFNRAIKDNFLENCISKNNISLKKIDLLDEIEVLSMDKDYHAIFHLAAIIGVKHVLNKPFSVLHDNIKMLTNIIELSHLQEKEFKRLLFSSTSEVYAGTLNYFDMKVPTPENTPLTVSDLTHPRTSYMLSKLYGEALCHHSNLPFTIFRPHNIYGPRMGMSHVIPEQLRKAYFAKEGDRIEVFSAEHTRAFCFIDDAIEMLTIILADKKCEGLTLNIGSESPEISILQLVSECHKIMNKKLKISSIDGLSGSPARRAPDMKQTQKILNFKSQIGLTDGLKETFRWYKDNVFENEGNSAI
tara:strand:+ start:2418 stop:3416 length:999 start_codon:yes stop_codon:yes gene_type:complete